MAVRLQFLGLIGAGKTYLAKLFSGEIGGYQLAFAQEVYRLAELLLGRAIDKANKYDREILKLVGTTWGRRSQTIEPQYQTILEQNKPKEWGSENIWVEIFIKNCALLPPSASIFNDDTRFKNELFVISKTLDFIPVFVHCRETTRTLRLSNRGEGVDPKNMDHESEEMIVKLSFLVLEQFYMPVIWNDTLDSKPKLEWVVHATEFKKIILESNCDNDILKTRFKWNTEKLDKLYDYL